MTTKTKKSTTAKDTTKAETAIDIAIISNIKINETTGKRELKGGQNKRLAQALALGHSDMQTTAKLIADDEGLMALFTEPFQTIIKAIAYGEEPTFSSYITKDAKLAEKEAENARLLAELEELRKLAK